MPRVSRRRHQSSSANDEAAANVAAFGAELQQGVAAERFDGIRLWRVACCVSTASFLLRDLKRLASAPRFTRLGVNSVAARGFEAVPGLVIREAGK